MLLQRWTAYIQHRDVLLTCWPIAFDLPCQMLRFVRAISLFTTRSYPPIYSTALMTCVTFGFNEACNLTLDYITDTNLSLSCSVGINQKARRARQYDD